MKEYAAGIQSSELRLVDAQPSQPSVSHAQSAPPLSVVRASNGTVEPRSGSAGAGAAIAPYNRAAPSTGESPANANAEGEPDSPTSDKFLIAATKEFEAGIVDQPLWKHAVAQSKGDRNLAAQSYLRARATALRVAKREKRLERRERRTRAMNELAQPGAQHDAGPTFAFARRRAKPSPKQVIWIGGTLAVLFVVAVFAVVHFETDAVQRDGAAAKPAAVPTAPVAKAARPATTATQTGTRDDAARTDWGDRLEKLKTDGNWNVVVLYAGEWARAQPDNPVAWKELAAGYLRLRQYRDALDAANKLVRLAPEDAGAWATLGQINAALRQPVEALAAFEQAAARDDHDAASIVQIGTLATQLGRLADARTAFSRALALNPADVDALCGAASVARREQRANDADALARQVAAQGARCREPVEGESVRVAVGDKTRAASRR